MNCFLQCTPRHSITYIRIIFNLLVNKKYRSSLCTNFSVIIHQRHISALKTIFRLLKNRIENINYNAGIVTYIFPIWFCIWPEEWLVPETCRWWLITNEIVYRLDLFFIVVPCILTLSKSLFSPTDALHICLGVH